MKLGKLMLCFAFISLLLIVPISANLNKDYTPEENKVEITDGFIIKEEVADITLLTPLDNHVGFGGEFLTAEYKLVSKADRQNVFNELELLDKNKNMESIDRSYKLKYKVGVLVWVNDTKLQCNELANKTEYCEEVVIGQHQEQREMWVDLISKDIIKGSIYHIGIFADVREGDRVEWIPNFFNNEIRIEEWAVWTADLNVNIVSYWKLDNNNFTDELGINTLTNVGTANTSGIILDGRDLDDPNDRLNVGDATTFMEATDNTLNLWFRRESTGVEMIVWNQAAAVGFFVVFESDNQFNYGLGTIDVTNINPAITDTNWHMLTYIYDNDAGSDNLQLYLDGLSIQNTSSTSTIATGVDTRFGIDGADTRDFDGDFDEIAYWNRTLTTDEITQLWNDGDGISYTAVFNQSPSVVLISPENGSSTSISRVSFIANATDDEKVENVTLFINGVANETNSSNVNGTYNFTIFLTEGVHNWSILTEDNSSLTNQSETRIITFHETSPTLELFGPTGNQGQLNNGDNLTLNWSVTEPGQNMTEHITNCTYTYNSTVVELNNTLCTQINQTNFTYIFGVDTITMNVTDSFNLTASQTTTWFSTISIINETFNANTAEGASEEFILHINVPNTQVSSGILYYNGTGFLGTINNLGNNIYKLSRSLVIPPIGNTANATFLWNVMLTDGNQTNTTINTQLVNNVSLDDCSSNSVVIINYTLVDEETQTIINGTASNSSIEVDIQIFSLDRTSQILNFSKDYSKINPAAICINIDSATEYSMDVQTRYNSETREPEFHHLQNFTLSNSTIPQNITLYDLLSTASTDFKITFKDENFLPVAGALIQINRKFVADGVFKTVEIPKTDTSGIAIGHFDTDTVEYRIVVTKDGFVIGTFSKIEVVCSNVVIGECNINLNAFTGGTEFEDYVNDEIISYSVQFDEDTKTISVDFVINDGSTRVVSVNTTKMDSFGNTTVCSDTITTSSGSLSCVVPDSFGNITIVPKLYVGDVFITQNIFTLPDNLDEIFEGEGWTLALFLMLTLPFLALTSTIGFIITTIIALAIIFAMFILEQGSIIGPTSALLWLFVSGGILVYKIARRGE